VKINPRQTNTTNTFEEFPNDPDLAAFDPSDQKWIALAFAGHLTYKEIIPIIQAVDVEKWRGFVTTLRNYNIEIDFICETPDTQLSEVGEREKTRRSRAKKKRT
jgi:hypothetical protein